MSDEPGHKRGWNKRLLLGIVLLFFVDVIWVVSAELTEFVFHDSNFNKPFFTTYMKTSMFVLYLLGFLFVKRWQYQVLHISKSLEVSERLLNEVEHIFDASKQQLCNEQQTTSPSPTCSEDQITLPIFENMTDDDASVTDSDQTSSRRVTFNSVREVRSLTNSEHGEAQVLARMSQIKISELRHILTEICKKISLGKTMKIALHFVFLWILATLMYQEALSQTSAAVTNILSSTSGIFTLLLAALFPTSIVDKFSLTKLAAVLFSFGGIFLICWTDPNREKSSFNFGELYALLGALFYACYLVLVNRKAGEDNKLDIPLFLGFVGLFGLLLFWPIFFILHYTNIERFELPTHKMTWMYLIINGVIGTAISELLWLWGCFLTSSLMATLALGFVIPMTMIWDIVMNHIKFSALFIVGTIPIILSFIVVSVLTYYGDGDPLKEFILKYVCCKTRTSNEEKEGLLDDEIQTNDELEPVVQTS